MKLTKKIIKSQVEAYLKKYQINKCKIIVALSGGADSATLINILSSLKEYNLEIIAAYFNHNLRDNNSLLMEEEIIKKISTSLNIKYRIGMAKYGYLKERAKKNSLSLEEVARIERYNFLRRIKKEESADYIATAHNLNDNTETMLMRFLSNSGIYGLSGIPEKRDDIIRPLSYVDRKDIERYISENDISVSIDKTNNENIFLRNKVRNLLLPTIRNVFPDVDKNLKKLADSHRKQNEVLDMFIINSLNWGKNRKWLEDKKKRI